MRIPASSPGAAKGANRSGRRMAAARASRTVFDGTIGAGFFVAAFLVPLAIHGYPIVVLTDVLVYTVALLSLVLLTGYVGQISLCQASFMGLGGFLTAALIGHYGWSFWVAGAVSIVVVFLAGVAVGLPALRLRGLTLAIVTLSLALLADNFLFVDVPWLNNDTNGFQISRPTLFGISLDNPDGIALYRVILVVAAVAMLLVIRIRRGRTGKSWYAMRDAEIAAATSGVPITRMKLLAFGIAAGLAALAGVLYLLAIETVSATQFNFVASIQLLALVVIAGTRSLPGAVLGAFIYVVLPQYLLQYPTLAPLTSVIVGVGLIVQVITAPQGLGGLLETAESRLFRALGGNSPTRASEPPPADAMAVPTRGERGERKEGRDATL